MDDSRTIAGRTAAPPLGGALRPDAAAPQRGDGVFALAPEHRVEGGAPEAPAPGAAASDPDGVFALTPAHRVDAGAPPAPCVQGAQAAQAVQRAPQRVLGAAEAPGPPDGAAPDRGRSTADRGAAPDDKVGAAPDRSRSIADDEAGAQVAQAVQRELERVLGAKDAPDLRGFVADEVRRALRGRAR